MSILKLLFFGAAAAAGYNYVTKKRPDGKSIVDDITERVPEWMDKAKKMGNQVKDQFSQRMQTNDIYQP